MKKFKVIKQYHDMVEGTIVIDGGLAQLETNSFGQEHRIVIVEGSDIPLSYAIPLDHLEEVQ